MPRECSKCEEMKPSAEFSFDKRTKSGYESRCKKCKNAGRGGKIPCENCGRDVQKWAMAAHLKSARCMGGDKPWHQFAATGKAMVKCPCAAKQCQVKVSEATAYRHLKYGAFNFRVPKPQATDIQA